VNPLTYLLLQAISFNRPQYAPLHYTSFSLAGSVTRSSFPRIAQPHSSFLTLSAVLKNASPASLHSVPFVKLLSILIHSIPFSTPQQHIAPIPLPCRFACYRTFALLPPGRLLTHIQRHSVQEVNSASTQRSSPAFQFHSHYKLLSPSHLPTLTS
jgi:hypothetical protein